MKYYLIVGEASGDLHASNLMRALKEQDAEADFRFFGGDLMSAVGGTRVKHYKELAYMGFIPVLLHLRTIFRNMDRCKADPAFVAAFSRSRKLTEEEIDAVQSMIDRYRQGE